MRLNFMKEENDSAMVTAVHKPYRVTLPGFINEEIGLGDVIKRATYALGIKPCGGCERRAATLNQWMVFTGYREK